MSHSIIVEKFVKIKTSDSSVRVTLVDDMQCSDCMEHKTCLIVSHGEGHIPLCIDCISAIGKALEGDTVTPVEPIVLTSLPIKEKKAEPTEDTPSKTSWDLPVGDKMAVYIKEDDMIDSVLMELEHFYSVIKRSDPMTLKDVKREYPLLVAKCEMDYKNSKLTKSGVPHTIHSNQWITYYIKKYTGAFYLKTLGGKRFFNDGKRYAKLLATEFSKDSESSFSRDDIMIAVDAFCNSDADRPGPRDFASGLCGGKSDEYGPVLLRRKKTNTFRVLPCITKGLATSILKKMEVDVIQATGPIFKELKDMYLPLYPHALVGVCNKVYGDTVIENVGSKIRRLK